MCVYKESVEPEKKHRCQTSLYEILDALGSAAGTRDSEVVTSLLIHMLASGRGRVTRPDAVGGSSRIAGVRPAKLKSLKEVAAYRESALNNVDFVSGL